MEQANKQLYVLDLENRMFDCGNFQRDRNPGGNNSNFINAFGDLPRYYVADHFTVAGWEKTAIPPLQPVNILDQTLATDCTHSTKRQAPA